MKPPPPGAVRRTRRDSDYKPGDSQYFIRLVGSDPAMPPARRTIYRATDAEAADAAIRWLRMVSRMPSAAKYQYTRWEVRVHDGALGTIIIATGDNTA